MELPDKGDVKGGYSVNVSSGVIIEGTPNVRITGPLITSSSVTASSSEFSSSGPMEAPPTFAFDPLLGLEEL